MRAALLCAVGLLPAACLEPAVETCADGTVCPATSVCVPGGCAPRSSIAACEGLDAGAVCELAGGQGRCRDEVCVVASCGDGVTDPDEACDDGNNLDGDGCARDCDSTEVCGDGVRDVGEQCDLGADNADTPDSACRTTCQVPACGDEIVDPDRGESCDDGDANADVPDAGCRTSCQVPRCGDGIVDGGLGEACDDGNTVGADGCAFDCGSDERCGNGTVDYAVGERCDDGNRRERDGCASSCQVETVLWQPLAGTPQLRADMSLAYDPTRRVTVMFGGGTSAVADGVGTPVADTWEWDGVWVERAVLAAPSARSDHAMAFDGAAGRIVLFGGNSSGGRLNDTWTWDGAIWERLAPATSPTPRSGHGMVYDGTRRRMVLFGGFDGASYLADTWAWDGVTWTQQAVVTPPSARHDAAMAYDPVRDRVVLVGGGSGVSNDQHWELAGNTWTNRSAAVGVRPSKRFRAAMTYDAARARMVLSGGFDQGAFYDEHWEFDGAAWSLLTPSPRPDARSRHALAYDLERRATLDFGGFNYGTGFYNQTWLHQSGAWTEQLATTPSARETALAADPTRGSLLAFGGRANGSGARLGDTWELVGSTWIARTPAGPTPSARYDHALTHDPARGATLLFGGSGVGNVTLGDTWRWTGTAWTAGPAGPPARALAALAYDDAGGHAVLFGGRGSDGEPRDDTWVFDGDAWTEQALVGPPARFGHALAYDRARDRVVLFGGQADDDLGDTWELGPDGWVEVVTAEGPSPRSGHALAYDPNRGAVVLFGGRSASGLVYDDAWVYAAEGWTELPVVRRPGARVGHGLAYDTVGRRLILFGGDVPSREAWTLGYEPSVRGEACAGDGDLDDDGAAGCADRGDCWAACEPLCPPVVEEAGACELGADGPRCGDLSCDPLEDCRTCPADCAVGTPSCPVLCGDLRCEDPESAGTCPGDCTP